MSNDLSRGLFPANNVKLLVVDEAHRAQGEYAYCLVVRELQRSRTDFRVVALSATPGTDLNGNLFHFFTFYLQICSKLRMLFYFQKPLG